MTGKPTLPSVEVFFARYKKTGHIFEKPLNVRLRNGNKGSVVLIYPNYAKKLGEDLVIKGIEYTPHQWLTCWGIKGIWGKTNKHEGDIIAVLDDAGNVVAGEVV